MTITAGAIERSVVREQPESVPDDTLDRLGEFEQQFQVEVTGTATATIVSADVDLTFDVEFIDGRFQRYSNLVEPMMSPGSEVESGDTMVLIEAHVRAWVDDDRGAIIGATVRIGVHSPGAGDPVAFAGKAHLRFQGFGSVPNEPSEPDFA